MEKETEQRDEVLAELELKVAKAKAACTNPGLQAFAEEYAIDKNGTRSWIAAGYAVKSAHTESGKALRKPEVMSYIDALNALASYKRGVKKEDNIAILKAIRDSDIADYLEYDEKSQCLKMIPMDKWTKEMRMAVEGIKMGKYGIELKLQGKSWAIDMLNKNLGLYEKDNKQKGEGLAAGVGILLPANNREQGAAGDEPTGDV